MYKFQNCSSQIWNEFILICGYRWKDENDNTKVVLKKVKNNTKESISPKMNS